MKITPKQLRAQAEKLLITTRRDVAGMPVDDVQKLVHELQVHQIELEMQNDELRQTQLELEAARERLLLPYDAAPVGFLSLDAQGVIREANLAAAKLLNFDREKLAGQKFTRFIASEGQDVFYLHRRQLASTGEKQTCELPMLLTGDVQFYARLEMVVESGTRSLVMFSDISARKHAEAALLESRARLKTFAEATFEGIVESEAGVIIDCNEQYARMVGWTVDELKGTAIANLIPPADRERVMAKITAGQEQSVEHPMLRKDGTQIFVEVHGSPVAPGSARRHSSVRDITARKQAEEALRLQSAALRAAASGIVITKRDGTIEWVNPAFTRLTGYSAAEAVGQNPRLLKSWQHPASFYAGMWATIAAGQVWRGEVVNKRKDGTLYLEEMTITPARDDTGAITHFVAVKQDITARKQAEEDLRRISEREQFLAAVVEQAVVPFGVGAPDGRLLMFNQAFAELTGYSRAELEQQQLTWNSSVTPPEWREAEAARLAEAVSRRQPVRYEKEYLRKDGTRVPIELVVQPEFAPDGQLRQYRSFLTDITERKQAEEMRRQYRVELERRVRERTAELSRTNTALGEEKAFADSLIELAPAVIAVMDRRGNLIRTNAYTEQLAGVPFAESQGQDMIANFVPKPEQPRMRRLLRETLQGRAVQQTVASLRLRDGSTRQIEWFAKPLANAEGRQTTVLAIGHDITERKQAEEALQRSEQNLTNFFNQAPIGLIWLSASGTILRTNQAQLELLGYAAEDYVGHSFIEFCGESGQSLELLRRLGARETVRNYPLTRRCKDGSTRHVLVDATSLWNGHEFQYSSVFLRDITDRVKLEREILQAGEREHRRIGQDLHDGLGQLLAGAAYLAGNLRKDLAAKSLPKEVQQSRRIQEALNEAIAQARSLARGLHPVEAEPNGLMVALAELAARTKKMFQVGCHFNCRRPVLIHDSAVATHLFRIAQEAATNAIKHGKPGRIEISLTKLPGRICLAVRDDGSGMAVAPKKPGMGLRIMRYRAGMIGGSLGIQHEAGGGTTVVCTVQLTGPGGRDRPPQKTARKTAAKELKSAVKRKPKD